MRVIILFALLLCYLLFSKVGLTPLGLITQIPASQMPIGGASDYGAEH